MAALPTSTARTHKTPYYYPAGVEKHAREIVADLQAQRQAQAQAQASETPIWTRLGARIIGAGVFGIGVLIGMRVWGRRMLRLRRESHIERR